MHLIWIIFIFAMGACVGSFLNVVIWRMPRGQSIVFPGSHCPSCGRAIKWYDNIPLLSWLMLRGKCRFCKVSISPRYLIVEAGTALMVIGLYACMYILDVRENLGVFEKSWPMFVSHAALLCGLLGCSLVDIETFTVPLEVCWFVSLVGIVISTIWPGDVLMPSVSPTLGASCLGGAIGMALAILLLSRGLIQPSFVDADYRGDGENEKKGGHKVAITSASGVNPRLEILRELIFLAPIFIGAIAAGLLVAKVDAVGSAWQRLYALADGRVGMHLGGLFAAMFGYFIGAIWIWGMRIFGTLAFGKEAMGLGDVHILAAVGAVTGWIIPSLAFFLAPLFGLLWALFLLIRKGQRELPYGPWLSAGAVAAMIFHDKILIYFFGARGMMSLMK